MQQWQSGPGEADKLSQLDPEQLSEGSHYLIEIDFSSLHNAGLWKQSYLIFAMWAAVKAGWRSAYYVS